MNKRPLLPRNFRYIPSRTGLPYIIGVFPLSERKSARTIAVLSMEDSEVRILQYFSISHHKWMTVEVYVKQNGRVHKDSVRGPMVEVYSSSPIPNTILGLEALLSDN